MESYTLKKKHIIIWNTHCGISAVHDYFPVVVAHLDVEVCEAIVKEGGGRGVAVQHRGRRGHVADGRMDR